MNKSFLYFLVMIISVTSCVTTKQAKTKKKHGGFFFATNIDKNSEKPEEKIKIEAPPARAKGLLFANVNMETHDASARINKVEMPPLRSQTSLHWPLTGYMPSSFFGPRGRRHHNGVDIPAPAGTKVESAEAGQVTFVGWVRGYGRLVKIQHKDATTLYGHLSRFYVKKGAFVKRGERIAAVGRSGNARGNHLHFEVHNLDGQVEDPMERFDKNDLFSVNDQQGIGS